MSNSQCPASWGMQNNDWQCNVLWWEQWWIQYENSGDVFVGYVTQPHSICESDLVVENGADENGQQNWSGLWLHPWQLWVLWDSWWGERFQRIRWFPVCGRRGKASSGSRICVRYLSGSHLEFGKTIILFM